MSKRERPDKAKDWPEQTREPYKRLFDLQERLRARLKLAQELAVHNLEVNGNLKQTVPDEDPSFGPLLPGYVRGRRKSNPIPVVGKQPFDMRRSGQPKDYLKEYQDEELPWIRYYLSRMQGEIEQIKKAFTSGRRPNWLKQILKVEDLTVDIWEKMDDIQGHLLLSLRFNSQALKESNQVIIDGTRAVIETALKIRSELAFLRPGRTIIGPDKFGIYDTIIDPTEPGTGEQAQDEQQQHIMDFTTIPTWQQDLHKKKQR